MPISTMKLNRTKRKRDSGYMATEVAELVPSRPSGGMRRQCHIHQLDLASRKRRRHCAMDIVVRLIEHLLRHGQL